MTIAEEDVRSNQEALANSWRYSPDKLGAWVTRNDPVTEGFGGGFQIAGPYLRPKHIRLIGKEIAAAISKGKGRLIINQPPQTGKSELVSKWTPAWAQHVTNGRARILLGSYQSRYAAGWGAKTQQVIRDYGDELLLDMSRTVASRDVWETTEGGGMRTGGVESAMTGLPGDIIIIDDPFKNFKEAHSKLVRDDVWDWFWSVPMTRIQPGSTVIVLHTRWHSDDLTGRIMNSSSADRWNHIRIPALCDDPENDRLGREFGESLWPERFNREHYLEVEKENGPYKWAGMFQQLPAPLEGELFKRVNWKRIDYLSPSSMQLVRRWDLAGTEDDGDYTAGVLMGRNNAGDVFIFDIQHERMSSSNVEKLISDTADRDAQQYGSKVKIRLEQEPGSAGKSVALRYVKQLLAGHHAEALRSTGDKFIRALPFAAAQERQDVYLVRPMAGGEPAWFEEFIEEAAVFPNGGNDDMVDAASHAYSDLVEFATKRGKATMESMAGESLNESGPQTGAFQRPVGGKQARQGAPRTKPPGM